MRRLLLLALPVCLLALAPVRSAPQSPKKESDGGHLACLLGSADKTAGLEGRGGNPEASSRVQAVVSFFGPTDFTTKDWPQNVEDMFLAPLIGDTYEKAKDAYRRASPIVYVTK